MVVVLRQSLESGKLREVPRSGHDDRYIELEGPQDLVVEVVSDGSVAKDTRRLPALYARAGVGELWRLDARSEELSFEILTLTGDTYERASEEGDGWIDSPLLGHPVRLTRLTDWSPRWRYRLEKR